MSGEEPSLRAWQSTTERAGVPFERLGLGDECQRRLLISRLRRADLRALILASADVLDAALSNSQRHTLEALERALRMRRLIAYAYPSAMQGSPAPAWAGALDRLDVELTKGARKIFPYVRGPLMMDFGS